MGETVFVFGAGINRGIFDWDGLQPPLANDFFQLALKHPRIGDQPHRDSLQPLFQFIKRYWKLNIEDLENQPFALEDCYTMIQLQVLEAQQENDIETWSDRIRIYYELTAFLAEYLSQFESFIHNSYEFQQLGKILYDTKPAVLTFNYDTLLESAIESASGINSKIPATFLKKPPEDGGVPTEELTYSHFNWNRPLAYGIRFDEIQLHRAGTYAFASKEDFYSPAGNALYSPPFLKLHGSVNWFEHTGYDWRDAPHLRDTTPHEDKKGKTVIYNGGSRWFNNPPLLGAWILEPLIVTPTVHKATLSTTLFSQLWKLALDVLANCQRLVVAGYSFPPTDFHTRRLFLEAFSENTPEEVVVANPETSVVRLVKEPSHFRKPVLVCRDLGEFVTRYK